MSENQLPTAPIRKSSPILRRLLLTGALCLTVALAWILTGDVVQRQLVALRSTSDLEKEVRSSQTSPWPYYTLGIRYAHDHRIEEAARLFETARQKDAGSFEIRFALGKAYILLNAPNMAVPELEKAVDLHANDAGAYTYLAMARRLTGNRPAALEAAKQATSLDPRKAEAWYQYGILFTAEANNEEEGRPFLKKAVDLMPEDGVYNFAYGSSLTDGSQFEDAIPYLRRATRMLPNNAYAHFLLAISLHRSGKGGNDQQEALAELKRSLELAPNDYRAHFELGNILEEQSQFAAALPEFETASRLNPNLAEIWFHLSRMADRTGKPALAAKARARFVELRRLHVRFQILVRQLQKHPEDSAAQLEAGQVLEKQGNLKGAAMQYNDVLNREPQNAQAQTLLESARRRLVPQSGPPSPRNLAP